METFLVPTRILSGPGAVGFLRDLHPRRLFLVTDPYFLKNGRAEAIGRASGAEQLEIFGEVAPDPSLELAAAGTRRLLDFQPDLLAALGGGSAMDLAKAIAYFASFQGKLAAIPTTSGSGSEVTSFAILTHQGVKHPLVDESIRPDYAILDSDLLRELPTSLIADAGFDAISHALEAWVGTRAGALSDLYAREAFCQAMRALPGSFRGDREQRLPMHLASTMAGIAFTQAGLGLCHGLSHCLGGQFHVPHGRLNAILLPEVLEVNSQAVQGKYAALARAAGLGGSADVLGVRNLKNALIRLRREMKLPKTLAEAGISRENLEGAMDILVAGTLADPCCETNPRQVTETLVRQVLDRVTGHG